MMRLRYIWCMVVLVIYARVLTTLKKQHIVADRLNFFFMVVMAAQGSWSCRFILKKQRTGGEKQKNCYLARG